MDFPMSPPDIKAVCSRPILSPSAGPHRWARHLARRRWQCKPCFPPCGGGPQGHQNPEGVHPVLPMAVKRAARMGAMKHSLQQDQSSAGIPSGPGDLLRWVRLRAKLT
eukprot:1137480-Pelagomonas_calceolata.AAC.4